jgi:hypothetical protein
VECGSKMRYILEQQEHTFSDVALINLNCHHGKAKMLMVAVNYLVIFTTCNQRRTHIVKLRERKRTRIVQIHAPFLFLSAHKKLPFAKR